ncbi:MAG: UDP-N-acetylmuramate dehydrogenase [Bacteroidales bacterium]|nr:UDP-N-acetylmuramate dehydrogenase [Bacteroidales bacterium]
MKIYKNFDLTNYNSYHLHSVAENVFFPETIEDFEEIIGMQNLNVIGGGCNIIFSKEKYEKENFIFVRENFSGIEKISANTLRVKSGTDLKDLSVFAMDNSLSGMEFYYDIPGTVGGATIMNAGCQGVSFSDFILTITYFDVKENVILKITKDEAAFGYRKNIFSNKNVFILEVELKLSEGRMDEIRTLMEKNKEIRWNKQPREFPNAGSVFKRPDGFFVGPMITEVGLKGKKCGGAMISDKHAGFIINVDNATASDIMNLIQECQEKVKEKFGVDLNLEQKII